MRNVLQGRREFNKARSLCRCGLREFVLGFFSQEPVGRNAHALFIDENHVPVLQTQLRHFPLKRKEIKVKLRNGFAAADDFNVAVAAAGRINAARTVNEGENGINRAARIAARMVHEARYVNGNRLRALQIDVDLNVICIDAGNRAANRREELAVREAANMNGAHFRDEDVSLLIDNKNVVVGANAPYADHDAVARREHVVVGGRVAEGRRKAPLKEIRSKGLQANRCGRAEFRLRPGGRGRHRLLQLRRLKLLRG